MRFNLFVTVKLVAYVMVCFEFGSHFAKSQFSDGTKAVTIRKY